MRKFIVFLFVICISIASVISCNNKGTTGPTIPPSRTEKTNVAFRDDFDGTEINKDVWTLCYQEYGKDGNSPTWNRFFDNTEGWENVRVEDGYLKLKANYAPNPGAGENKQFKTGGVYTIDRYGPGTCVSVKAALVEGNGQKQLGSKFNIKGAFPAVWYYPLGTKNPWPADGEIDLMEWVTSNPDQAWLTIQCLRKDGSSRSVTADKQGVNKGINMATWHTYTCDIIKDKVILYIDGTKALEFTPTNPPDQKWYPYNDVYQYLILNASYQNGSWGPGPDKADSSNYEMWVDWVEITEIDPNTEPTAPTFN